MADIDNQVPDDEQKSSKPDAIVTIEEVKPETSGEKTEVKEAKADTKGDAASEGVEALTKNLEEANKRRAEAERKVRVESEGRRTAEARVKVAESQISEEMQRNIEANRLAAVNDKAAAQAELEKAETDYIALQQEGKFKEAFDATKRGAKAQQRLDYADAYLTQLDGRVAELEKKPTAEQEPASRSDDRGTVDPVTGTKFTPTTYEWISKHKDEWQDVDFRIECDAASRAAKRKGLTADTPEYFEFIDKRLEREGYLEAKEAEETTTETEEEKPVEEIKVAPKVAPKKATGGGAGGAAPSRAVPGTNGVAKKGVKLSGAQRDTTAAILESLPDWFKGENPDVVAAKAVEEAAKNGEQWAIDQLNNR